MHKPQLWNKVEKGNTM